MPGATDRRRADAEARANERETHDARPATSSTALNPADPRGPHYWPCPARLGRRHDISMRRVGGGFACWYCAKSKAQLLAEADAAQPAAVGGGR